MAASKSRLGRGLGGLIAKAAPKNPPATTAAAKTSAPATAAPAAQHQGIPGFIEIAVSSVVPSPTQARQDITPNELQELADSIRAEGLLQPIVVRKQGDKYQLIAGERRWRAFQVLKLKTIPARLTTASDTSAAVLGLIENLQREGLNPIDEAQGYASLIRDFKLTAEIVADRVGKKRPTIANALRLLQLDAELQGYVATNRLSVGHAKVLLGVDDAAQRSLLARRVIAEALNVRDTELLVQKHKHAAAATGKGSAAAKNKTAPADAATVATIERKLTSHFGSRVAVHHTAKKGKIVIEYAGNSDLQRILEKLGVEA
ncbi:ParB family chromosome partitioning protein [Ereboglobus sp. PH5-5]|uniref:ParB/RepB/Spo0J family partition protein n=1 Tax=unclassified Ereboglobus TaxID=2626932 RepID=UPI002406858C|nr:MULTISPECIES: ParB/RepB/Spo0J family partition protein [unclassified Ereboglobus]MDF9827076.1 ParB family chromosome partitioning protein [Ereboglobus sp. PH5-10]MDF9832491.1 ParB family chromosome partitioning protein [Ereboglobus sp. PH5-5]